MPHLLAFDSGIGGYGIVGCLRTRLAHARITMLADNAFYPYGEIGDAALIRRIEWLVGRAIERLQPDLVVIACNTASTVALPSLRARFDLPFVGCVPPIKWAATISRTRHIGLLATAATVRRPYLQDLAQRFAADCRLIAHGARGLADLAEAAFRGIPPDREAIRRELGGLFGQPGGERIDTVCIGCTHYSFLIEALRAESPPGVTWLDPAAAVARRTESVLAGLAVSPGHDEDGHDEDGHDGDGHGGGGHGGGGGAALFTALPPAARDLLPGLATFGYEGLSLFAAAGGE